MCKLIRTHKSSICAYAAIVLAISYVISIGLFQSINPYETTLPSVTFCYKNYQQPYYSLTTQIQTSTQYIQTHSFLHNNSAYLGLYYDNPLYIKIPRSTIGFYTKNNLTGEQMQQIKEDGYEIKQLPSSLVVQAYMPLKTTHLLSLVLLKIYHPFLKALSSRKYENIYFRIYEYPMIECIQDGWFILSYSIDSNRGNFLLSNYSKEISRGII